MKNHTNIKVGNGCKISFWEDRSHSLKGLFPELAGIAVQQNVSVPDIWTQQGWDNEFRKNFNDWDSVIEFFRMLEEFRATSEEADFGRN